jgi:hypothetical protein
MLCGKYICKKVDSCEVLCYLGFGKYILGNGEMKYKSYLYIGHLLVLTLAFEVYLLFTFDDFGKKDFLWMIWFPIWIVGAFRTWFFWLATIAVKSKLIKVIDFSSYSIKKAFMHGCFMGLADLLSLLVIGMPLYAVYKHIWSQTPSGSIWLLCFAFFTITTLAATILLILLLARTFGRNLERHHIDI